MENASQALLISAGVLFAIIILTIGVFLHGELSDFSDKYIERLDEVELRKYNSNFDIYKDRENITAQEIVTAASTARQKERGTKVSVIYGTSNIYKEPTNKNHIDFDTEGKFNNWANEFLTDYIVEKEPDGVTEKNLFECISITKDEYGMINEVQFKQIK